MIMQEEQLSLGLSKRSSQNYMICVVVLHYTDADMTCNYIDNLLNLDWSDIRYQMIIVDNASPDGSGELLKEKYAQNPSVDVVLLNTNEGFARGNNAGIKLAQDKYDPDLIIVSNNDIIIEDCAFPQKLCSIFARTHFDLFGPDIYSITRNYHQSPIRDHHLNINEINEKIKEIDKTLGKLRILDKLELYNILRNIKKKINPITPNASDYDKYQEDVVLQGAFFVLSKNYLSKYPDGLYPGTFLYMEEDILNYRISKSGLKSVYDPSICVKHLEGAATHKQSGDRCKKYIFELEQTRLSCLKMIEYMHGN